MDERLLFFCPLNYGGGARTGHPVCGDHALWHIPLLAGLVLLVGGLQTQAEYAFDAEVAQLRSQGAPRNFPIWVSALRVGALRVFGLYC